MKLHLYREEFLGMNLGFGLPRSDTCIKCDNLDISIQDATMTGDQPRLSQLLLEKEQHHRKAEKAYELMSNFSKEASTFQQNLPIPGIPSGDMFYSRMLWVYNFGVHDGLTGDGIMHLWDETIAKRGSSEVCSCLESTIISGHTEAKRLVVFSDSCCGQNKNKAILGLWARLSSGQPYSQIDHMYLIRGHTYLPNDRDFGLIETLKRKHQPVLPNDYNNIISNARLIQPFEVVYYRLVCGVGVYIYRAMSNNCLLPV